MRYPSFFCWLGLGTLLLTVGRPAAQAQRRLSLPEALSLGLQNRFDVQANQLGETLAANAARQTRQRRLPTVQFAADARYNTRLPATVIPAGLQPGTGEQRRVTFGTRNNTVLALELNQPLYRPGALFDRLLAENDQALQHEEYRQTQADVKVRIAEAYLNVLLRELQHDLARADARRYKSYFEISGRRYRLGALLEGDYLTAQLNWQHSQLAAQQARQTYRAAQQGLCYELNLPTDTTLVLTDRINPDAPAVPAAPAPPAAERPVLQQLRLRQHGYELQVQQVRAGRQPTVALYGSYASQFQQDNFAYFTRTWTPYNYVGLQATVPLTRLFTAPTEYRAHQLRAQQTALTLKQTQADIDHETSDAQAEQANAARNLQSTQASLAVAWQLYRTQQQLYELGTALMTQVLDAEKSLQTAQQNHIEAAYRYLVAQLRVAKARGEY